MTGAGISASDADSPDARARAADTGDTPHDTPHIEARPQSTTPSAPLPPAWPEPPAAASAAGDRELTDTGPTISSGSWLADPDHWLITGSHQVPRPVARRLPRPRRFRRMPGWMSAVVLAVVLLAAVVAGVNAYHLAASLLPPQRHTTQPTPTHTPTRTPTRTR
ncbi:MAG: hypothetical protein IVW57_02180 [Ktedonobacterales bacterium]|nr:hypothetical protein [Ktedonobacterales bacterium]